MELDENISKLLYSNEAALVQQAWKLLSPSMQERLLNLANWYWKEGIDKEEYWEDLAYTFCTEKLWKKLDQLTFIHPDIGYLKHLKRIAVYHNLLTDLPESITTLSQLEYLDLYCNRIQKLPNNIGNLKQLKRLDLYQNELKIIPDSIGDLENLEHLNLSDNPLLSIPKSIAKLKKLKKFYLPYGFRETQEAENLKLVLPNCEMV